MTNLYRVTGPEGTLRKVFGSKYNKPMSASHIVSCLEDANTDNLFWNFWDLCNGPLVGVDSFKAYPEGSAYTYWWDDPSQGGGYDGKCVTQQFFVADLEELKDTYVHEWKERVGDSEIIEPFIHPLAVTDARMIQYVEYVNSKTGWGLHITLPAPALTDEQKEIVRNLAQNGTLKNLQNMFTDCGEETYTYTAAVALSEDNPDEWEYLATILELDQPLELGVTFDQDEEGDADEASATANVLHTTWGEDKVLEFLGLGDDWEPDLYTTFGSVYYPNLMSIKRKELDK